MADRNESWEQHLQAITDDGERELRAAAIALIADEPHHEDTITRLVEFVTRCGKEELRWPDDGRLRVPMANDAAGNGTLIAAAARQQAAIQTLLGIVGPERLLDESRFLAAIDYSGMLTRLGEWPDHIERMREAGSRAATQFKDRYPQRAVKKVQIFGVGGSGAPHDIAAEILSNLRKVGSNLEVFHADTPNADFTDQDTLAILASFSGNTEEVHHCYNAVKTTECCFVALTEGGELARVAAKEQYPLIQLPVGLVMQPRESVCLQMTGLLAFLASLDLPGGAEGSLTHDDLNFDEARRLIAEWRESIGPDVPYDRNRAKQLAYFLLYGSEDTTSLSKGVRNVWDKRIPFVLADRNNAALAHEVRTQMHERSKINAACYDAPECLHNLVESIRATAQASHSNLELDRWVYYFIRSSSEEPRIGLRLDHTIERVLQGQCTYATFDLEVANAYHRALLTTYFNAHMTTYLAVLNGCDPLPVPTMSWMKNVMSNIAESAAENRRPAEGRYEIKMNTPER